MLAPHLNPAIDAHMRFRLALQVSNVRRLIESPRNVWMTAHLPEEVRRFREKYPYGWQVAGTTLSNLFREHRVPWDDEDEEKVRSGHTRALTRSEDTFWREYLRPPVPVVTRPVFELPTDIRAHHELRAAVAGAHADWSAVRRGAQVEPVVAGPAYVRRLLTPGAVPHHA